MHDVLANAALADHLGRDRMCVYAMAPPTPEKATFQTTRARTIQATADPDESGLRAFLAAGARCAMTRDELLALNPYPGLRAFAVSEADLFFGRQRQVDELVERLHASTLVAVAGASGCGKSSLVLAGLLHELARRHVEKGGIEWRPVVMRPGNHPISNLASALSAVLDGAAAVDPTRAAALDGRLRLSGIGLAEAVRLAHLPPRVRVVVVVDQFEEIFRFRRMTDQDESAAFVKLLLHAAFDPESPVSVVLTLRSDTLGYCADFRDLPEAISRGQYLVPRLTRDQRKNAIVGPVELRGFRVAPRLVQRVLNDVSDDFDDLPVMQHALSRTWRRWATACAGSRPIDVEDYEAIGAAANALSMHADEAYDALTGQGAVVEKVFRALTERVAEGTEVRRPMQFDQLCAVTGCDRTAVAQVVERYRQGDTVFLLPAAAVPLAGNPVIDISHESLIRNWKRLKQWTDREAQSAQMIRRLFDAAERYATQTEGLLRDPALQFALDWRERNQPTAPWAALYGSQFERTMQFLDDSRDARDRERLAARRAARRRRWTVGLALVGSLIFGAVMAWQYYDSAAARREAEDARSRSLSRQLALLANSELAAGRLDRALLLGVAAMRQPTEEAQDILREALQSAPRRFLSGHRDEVSSVAFAPDGKSLASASQDGAVIYWDPDSGRAIGGFLRDSRNATARLDSIVAFGRDGSMLASPSEDGTAVLWSAANEPKRVVLKDAPEPPGFVATVVAVDADHRMIALARGEGDAGDAVSLWDLQTGRRHAVLDVPGQQVVSLAFSPDGATLAGGTSESRVLLWDVATGKAKGTPLRGHDGRVNTVAFSSDGRTLASGGSDRRVLLWDTRTRGSPVEEARGAPGPGRSRRLQPGRHAACVERLGQGAVRLGRRHRQAAWPVGKGASGSCHQPGFQPGQQDAGLGQPGRHGRVVGCANGRADRAGVEGPPKKGGHERRIQPRREDAGVGREGPAGDPLGRRRRNGGKAVARFARGHSPAGDQPRLQSRPAVAGIGPRGRRRLPVECGERHAGLRAAWPPRRPGHECRLQSRRPIGGIGQRGRHGEIVGPRQIRAVGRVQGSPGESDGRGLQSRWRNAGFG